MGNSITVAQALRHARHDFLNELQLIQMKLDLGREQDVQSIIRSHAEAAVQLNKLSALKMPATENWLLTAEWRFPEFHFQLECTARTGIAQIDEVFATWLERFFENLQAQIATATEHNCLIAVKEQQAIFEISLELDMDLLHIELPKVLGLSVRKEVAADNTLLVVSAKMEG